MNGPAVNRSNQLGGEMQIERTNPVDLLENVLPDGSRVLVDVPNERVIALNVAAGAAWDACKDPTTVAGVAEAMRRSLGNEVSDELAEEAVAQLQEQKLVKSAAPLASDFSRRAFIAKAGLAAVPLVVGMTMTEQRAYAKLSDSAKTTTPFPPPGEGGSDKCPDPFFCGEFNPMPFDPPPFDPSRFDPMPFNK